MAELKWDQIGEKVYETGVDHGVLYEPDSTGAYTKGVAWNGLTTVTESPSGAESNKQYADNIPYLNLKSAEEFGATIEAFTYPKEFEKYDGVQNINGVQVHMQNRGTFGFSWRTLVGNDLEGTDFGEKIHLAYNLDAAPSERAHATVNDSPEAETMSWEITSTPIGIEGTNPNTGKEWKPTAKLTIDSRDVPAASLTALKDILYGTEGADPRLPSPSEVIAMFEGNVVEVTPTVPTFDAGTDVITIPAVTGVVYSIDGADVPAGPTDPITEYTLVVARPEPGYKFPANVDTDWGFDPGV